MIRSELVQMLAAENPELSLADVDKLVSVVFGAITAQLAKGGRVELRGFGAFSTRAREGRVGRNPRTGDAVRSEEHTSELQSLMRISYAVFCLKKKKPYKIQKHTIIISTTSTS